MLASENFDDYNEIEAYPQNQNSPINEQWVGKHLIIALEVENVAITGLGTINANCDAFARLNSAPRTASIAARI